MLKSHIILTAIGLLFVSAGSLRADAGKPGHTHDQVSFSAGEPGDPKKPAQVIQIIMRENVADGRMLFIPDRIEVRKGDQVRFILRNNGLIDHEFILATTEENSKHAEEMRRYPDMEHDEPNARRLKPKQTTDIVWKFTKAGEFEFGCLIPGHPEAGMLGKVVVK
jgi:uncharacterized cupredoxin-like copper-binding protein